jgi:hypothetical protein
VEEKLGLVQGGLQLERKASKTDLAQMLHEQLHCPYHLVEFKALLLLISWKRCIQLMVSSKIYTTSPQFISLTFCSLMKQDLHETAVPPSIMFVQVDENSYAILQWRHQNQFLINLWN